MKKPRPFGLLGDVAFADEDPRQALDMSGGGASGATPNADAIGQIAYGLTNIGGLQDAAGLLGGPSLRENMQAGNKVDAVLQAASLLPFVGAMTAVPKAGRAAAKMAKAAETVSEAAPTGIIAYHGSPHSFDRFDISKIGTGEGAQAYGHGLYFADNEDVAKSYREFLSSRNNDLTDPGNLAASLLYRTPEGTREAAIREAQTVINSVDRMPAAYKHDPGVRERTQKALELLQSGAELPKQGGSMYQVRINADPEHFLDWDKPLNRQSAIVRALQDQRDLLHPFREDFSGLNVWHGNMVDNDLTGRQAYDELAQGVGLGDKGASKYLHEASIPGIKYLDQGSRGAGEGSRNYVVFDDKLVEILKKYGLVGLLGGGAALGSQSPNAQQGAPAL